MKKRWIGLCLCLSVLMASNISATEMPMTSIEQTNIYMTEEGYQKFLTKATNASLNNKEHNPLTYYGFLNIAFDENGYIGQAYMDFLKDRNGANMFVTYSEYMDIVLAEGSYLERAYTDFVKIFGEIENPVQKPIENINTQVETSQIESIFQEYISPLMTECTFTSAYGERSGGFHYGTDVKAPVGTPIVAVQSGIAYKVGPDSKGENKGGGKMIFIKHDDGHETRYMHLNEYAIQPGEYVLKGQVIGYVGNTGESTAPHLHLELLISGEGHTDPIFLYKKNPFFKE